MKVETYLPLGKTDPGIRAPDKAIDLSTLLEDAKQVGDLGYDTLVVEETKDDPYQFMAIAAWSSIDPKADPDHQQGYQGSGQGSGQRLLKIKRLEQQIGRRFHNLKKGVVHGQPSGN